MRYGSFFVDQNLWKTKMVVWLFFILPCFFKNIKSPIFITNLLNYWTISAIFERLEKSILNDIFVHASKVGYNVHTYFNLICNVCIEQAQLLHTISKFNYIYQLQKWVIFQSHPLHNYKKCPAFMNQNCVMYLRLS